MGRTQAVFYRDQTGRQPVADFLSKLDAGARLALAGQIRALSGRDETAPPPAFPATSHVQAGLRELRCHHGRDLYRVLYRRSGNLIVLLHAFAKRSRRIPASDIAIAEARWADLRRRMDGAPRSGPRPLGRDAPERH